MLVSDGGQRKYAHQIRRSSQESWSPPVLLEASKSRSSLPTPSGRCGKTPAHEMSEQITATQVQNRIRQPDHGSGPSRSVPRECGSPLCEPLRPGLTIQREHKSQTREPPAGQSVTQSRRETIRYTSLSQQPPPRRGQQPSPERGHSPKCEDRPDRRERRERRERQHSPERRDVRKE